MHFIYTILNEWRTSRQGWSVWKIDSLTNFLFISLFFFRRIRISSSFFRLVSSFLLFIFAISFCRDIKSSICSASDILLFTMLQVDTIYFPLHANSLDPTVGANCSRTGLEPRERFKSLFGRSVCTSSLPLWTKSSFFFRHSASRSPRNPGSDGNCKRHSDAQLRIRYSTLGCLSIV